MTGDFQNTQHRQQAFTLIELVTVIVVMSILALLVFATVSAIKAKAERSKCVNNLQGLYAAATSYLTDHESWPQISSMDLESPAFASSWIAAYKPYQIGTANWICATVQKAIGDPPDDPANPRIDYLPTS